MIENMTMLDDGDKRKYLWDYSAEQRGVVENPLCNGIQRNRHQRVNAVEAKLTRTHEGHFQVSVTL